MKKLLLTLFSLLLILSSCSIKSKKEEDNNISNKTDNIPVNFEIKNKDLLSFSKMLANDKDFFKSWKEDINYFYIWRDYLFWENNTKWKVILLEKCFNWEISEDKLEWIYKDICKGEDIYIKEYFTNFYHIKQLFLNLKEAKNNKNFNCKFFLDLKYKIEKSELQVRTSDYFSCLKVKNLEDYNLRTEYYFFNKSAVLWTCNSLKDKNLIKLCNERNKEFSKTIEE